MDWTKLISYFRKYKLLRVLVLGIVVVAGSVAVGWLMPAMFGYIAVPVSISVFGFSFRIYTLLVMLGMLSALAVLDYLRSTYKPLAKVDVWTGLIYVLVPGIFLARVYYVVTEWDKFNGNPVAFFQIDGGGLSIIGGFVGGVIGMWLYAKRNKIELMPLISAVAVVMPLAQAIGRFGNFFNKELFGFPTNVDWAMFVPQIYRPIAFLDEQFFHPLFLYEAIPNLILFIGLFWHWHTIVGDKKEFGKAIKSGRFVRIYIVGYMTLRFILDFYRIDGGVRWYGFTLTQVIYLVLLLFVVVFGLGYQLWFKQQRGVWFTDHQQIQ